MYVGGGRDVKATDFLTSLAALAPYLRSLHLGSQGWGCSREGLGGLRRGLCPSPLINSGFPCHFLGSERGLGILKMRGNDERKTIKNYINMYLK